MLRRSLIALGALMIGTACSEPGPAALTAVRGRRRRATRCSRVAASADGHYIIVFQEPRDRSRPQRARNGRGARRPVGVHTYAYALRGFAAELTPRGAAALQAHVDVALVEPDAIVTISGTQTGATWGLDRIDQASLPLNTTYTYNATGAGVNAYIIDTGIRTTHSEFGGRASGVFTSIADGNGANDCNGHGTHVAGTVGGATTAWRRA